MASSAGHGFGCVIARRGSVSREQINRLRSRFRSSHTTDDFSSATCRITVVGEGVPTFCAARWHHIVCAGAARFDNRAVLLSALQRRNISLDTTATDLEIAGALYAEHGASMAGLLEGDFAFVLYDHLARRVVAVRDIFGVRPLFYSEQESSLHFSSRCEALAPETSNYDHEYIAEFVMGHTTSSVNTMYRGVQRVAPAHVMTWRESRCESTRLWEPRDIALANMSFSDACDSFQLKFTDSVRSRMNGPTAVWADLSGGLDSSSIVVTAASLARAGLVTPLQGTRTYEDSLGDADERRFVDAVVQKAGVPSTRIGDDWPWRDDGELPPLSDEPSAQYPYFACERRMNRAVTDRGASIVLDGQGSDYYLWGNDFHFTDLLAKRRIAAAALDAQKLARSYRCSIWRIFWCYGIAPFVPRALRHSVTARAVQTPNWLTPSFVKSQDLRRLLPGALLKPHAERGRWFNKICLELESVPNVFRGELEPDRIEVRSPFLSRPLVELALSLAPEQVAPPGEPKRILRQALQNELPEIVRDRKTKGVANGRFIWALGREEAFIDELLRQPVLADIGIVDAEKLRSAVRDARGGRILNPAYLLGTLAMETWLSVRAGDWDALTVASSRST